MKLAILLEKKQMSVYQCAKESDIPYSTLLDLVREKVKIEKCSAETLYKLSKTLDISMEELVEEAMANSSRVAFETFKSNMCHMVKEKGDIDFIIETLKKDDISRYWRLKWYQEAYYTLAMVDYLSRINDIPKCTNYDSIRQTSLKEPLFPRDIEMTAKLDLSLDVRKQAIEESIPEFIRFNIVEKEIRNVC